MTRRAATAPKGQTASANTAVNYPHRVDVVGPDGTPLGCTADPGRLMDSIEEFAQLTSTAGRITRLAYTEVERAAHEIYGKRMRELGLKVWTDAAGNTIAERPGRATGSGAIGTGSHLDSVPGAGRFDGIAGVAAALEAARLAVEQDLPHRRALRFVAFAAEEGARFGQACLGSRFAAGLIDEHHLNTVRDRDGVTLAEAMRSVGLDPARAARTPWQAAEWSAFLELHVEQGGVLEEAGIQVGVVDLVSGSTRLQLRVTGQASHTGATPMHLRQDALTAAAEIVLIAETLATDPQHRGTRATVGRLDVSPGSITTIPGGVTFSLEVRDIDSDRQRSTTTEIVRRARAVCDRRRVGMEVSLLGDTSPVVLPMWLRLITAQACRSSGVSYRVMTSGASHDAQIIGRLTPASILFVPSRAGLSHVPEEWTSSSDLARGTSVLLNALLCTDTELDQIAALDSRNARGPATDDPSGRDDAKGTAVSLDDIPENSSLVLLPEATDTRPRAITVDAAIVRHHHAADRYWRLELLAPVVARTVQPGQFVMITPARRSETWPVLPRPMAVYDADADSGTITILYGVVGAGTRHLRDFTSGESLVTVGPLGRPFSLPSTARSLLVLGRGIGSCSLTLLAAAAHRAGSRVTVVASGRSSEATIAGDFYRSHGITPIEVYDSDGSSDPDALRACLAARETVADVIAVCGSRRLTRLAHELGTAWGAEVQVSLEAHMACGLGYCHGCSTGSRSALAEAPLICRDGPVFQLAERSDAVHV